MHITHSTPTDKAVIGELEGATSTNDVQQALISAYVIMSGWCMSNVERLVTFVHVASRGVLQLVQ